MQTAGTIVASSPFESAAKAMRKCCGSGDVPAVCPVQTSRTTSSPGRSLIFCRSASIVVAALLR